ncbi:hypothetical protein BDQ17DRAFT_1332565 [Cyathus striatus]|nr:hypothetical protein BDQ17DRAFT_1332565 [Cyathus striatus]
MAASARSQYKLTTQAIHLYYFGLKYNESYWYHVLLYIQRTRMVYDIIAIGYDVKQTIGFMAGCLIVISASVDLVFVLRVCALYGNSKRVVLFLVLGFIGLSLAFHATLFTLTFIRAGMDLISEHGGLRAYVQNESDSFQPLITAIMHDGALFFCVIFGDK